MKRILYLLLWMFATTVTAISATVATAQAQAQAQKQKLNRADSVLLAKQQDTLQQLADKILNGKTEEVRQQAGDQFIPILVRALKAPHSFRFRFDSLQSVSIQYPQDSAFRIFTWALENEVGFYRHYGAIQMNTKSGQLKLFPLFDNSDYSFNTDTVTDNNGWYGCLYYKIVQQHFFNSEYYTLFGYDANNPRSTKKLLDMLTFKAGKPTFGGPFFSFAEDTVPKPTRKRIILEYKKDATISLSYNPEMDMIVYDHLISATNEPGKPYTYVPDLDYEGFKWKGGKWVHIEKVFHDALKLGKFPLEHPQDQRKKNLMHPQTQEEMEAEKASKKPKNK